MGSIDPPAVVVDKEILDTLLAGIKQILAVLPSNVTAVDFDVKVKADADDHWVVNDGLVYKFEIEEMMQDNRLGVRSDKPFLTRITFLHLIETSPGKVNVRLLLTPSTTPAPVE